MKALIPLVVLALALGACADTTPGGQAVRQRDLRFGELGKAFKGIDNQLKGSVPDLAAVRADAARVASLAPQVKDWFPAGSGPQDGKRTDAKAEVWTRPDEFRKAAERLAVTAHALNAAAEAGDIAAVAAQANLLGAACKGCHDKFKDD